MNLKTKEQRKIALVIMLLFWCFFVTPLWIFAIW